MRAAGSSRLQRAPTETLPEPLNRKPPDRQAAREARDGAERSVRTLEKRVAELELAAPKAAQVSFRFCFGGVERGGARVGWWQMALLEHLQGAEQPRSSTHPQTSTIINPSSNINNHQPIGCKSINPPPPPQKNKGRRGQGPGGSGRRGAAGRAGGGRLGYFCGGRILW
jgi:hypothetical protein